MKSDILHAVEMEFVKSVLADPDQYKLVKDIYPEQLASPTARTLWSVIVANEGNVSAASLYHELGTFEAGRMVQASYPTIEQFRSLWSEGSAIGSAEIPAETLRQEFIRREVDRITEHRNAFLSPAEQAQAMARELLAVAYRESGDDDGFDSIEAGNKVVEQVLWKHANPHACIGWKSGDKQYDHFLQEIGGLMGEKLIVTAALTGRGKTQWLLNQSLRYATTERDDTGERAKVAYVSTEMNTKAIAKRVIAHFAEVNLNGSGDPDFEAKVLNGQKRWNELVGSGHFVVLPDVLQIDTIARRIGHLRHAGKVDIAVIDYIGMIQGSRANDRASSYSAVGDVVKAMQNMSRELEMPILTAAQLNRGTYENPGGKPDLSNIADSSVINNCANAVHMIYRPDLDSKHISGSNVGHWKDVVQLLTCKVRDADYQRPMFYHLNGGQSSFTEVPLKMRQILGSEDEQRRITGGR